jgi:uncharacterized metal-binding protein YceD (DUF177 family)
VEIERLGHEERTYELEASAEECAALAKRFGILAVCGLAATIRLKRLGGRDLFRLSGHIEAEVEQACVVTLEPVRQKVSEDFALTYSADREAETNEVVVDLDAEDPPELVEDGTIDIGEAAAEHLALALDPFPRADSAVFEMESDNSEELEAPSSPFAALAKLKKT